MTIDEKRNALLAFREAGESHICPTKAAPILGCTPYSLNVAAKQGHMPDSAYFFAGRNLRISVNWLMRTIGASAKKPRRRCNVDPEAGIKNHHQYITEEVGCQADKARGQAKPAAWPQPAARMTQAEQKEAQVQNA